MPCLRRAKSEVSKCITWWWAVVDRPCASVRIESARRRRVRSAGARSKLSLTTIAIGYGQNTSRAGPAPTAAAGEFRIGALSIVHFDLTTKRSNGLRRAELVSGFKSASHSCFDRHLMGLLQLRHGSGSNGPPYATSEGLPNCYSDRGSLGRRREGSERDTAFGRCGTM